MSLPISGRNNRLVAAWLAGESKAALAERYRISAGRVGQIIKANCPENALAKRLRLQKPRIEGQEARQKLVYFDDRALKLVERAARSLDPSPTSSYFIALAAEEKARAVLNLPA